MECRRVGGVSGEVKAMKTSFAALQDDCIRVDSMLDSKLSDSMSRIFEPCRSGSISSMRESCVCDFCDKANGPAGTQRSLPLLCTAAAAGRRNSYKSDLTMYHLQMAAPPRGQRRPRSLAAVSTTPAHCSWATML